MRPDREQLHQQASEHANDDIGRDVHDDAMWCVSCERAQPSLRLTPIAVTATGNYFQCFGVCVR